MKRLFIFLFAIITSANLFGQSLVDRGYLKLEGALPWNDSYVIYKLTTSNEKGGESKITFEEGSHDKLLKIFEYDSKDWFKREKEYSTVQAKIGSFENYPVSNSIYNLDNFFYNENAVENENAIGVIEEECNSLKSQLIKEYETRKENFQKLSSKEKSILRCDFGGSSGLNITYQRYADARNGLFTIHIYQKEDRNHTYLRISDYTKVYKGNTNSELNYPTLDEKVLAVCSEISTNRVIKFGILKENSLKPYKNCGFVLIQGDY